jgi:hypothetical protein
MTPAGEPVPPNVSPQLKEAPPAKEAPSGKKTVFDDDFLASPQIRSAGEKSIGEEKPGQPGAAAGEVAAPPGSGPALPASGGEPSKPVAFELEVSTGPRAAFDLREGENILGRGETSAIRIEDNSLSRQHAVITVASGRVTVKDLGSKNSTFVGNNRIREEVEITTGSDLRFGLVQARLRKKP